MIKMNKINTKGYINRLLLKMKPETKREEYAKKAAIASMLRARSEYDPQVQEYMREHNIMKETLEQWIRHWENKLKEG
ncbi:MAG: hypothetical protein H3Z52_06155 [archaeon]|nr:hypothetical protein [archaeon]MCP8320505.1 hypothetical protein [archaeon]